jgi:hypothetical protein
VRLSQLLASMVDPFGKVTIAGFNDDVVSFSPASIKMIGEAPTIAQQCGGCMAAFHRRRGLVPPGRAQLAKLQRT